MGPLVIDLDGPSITQDEEKLLQHPFVGGIILFSRNYQSLAQLSALLSCVRRLRPELLITVDQEGGRVQRFRNEFTQIPSMQCLGDLYRSKGDAALQIVQQVGWLMAAELLSVGVDLSFAPVLDLDKDTSTVIGDRSFGEDPRVCTKVAHAFCQGMRLAGMKTSGKHFPGHGGVAADSHVESPIDNRSLTTIVQHDIQPFAAMIQAGLMDVVMLSHVIYPSVDQYPAVFSPIWIKQQLQVALGFRGTVFSDDLSMAGAKVVGDVVQRVRFALQAGCHKVLVCNDREAVNQVLSAVDSDSLVAPVLANQSLPSLAGSANFDTRGFRTSSQYRSALQAVLNI